MEIEKETLKKWVKLLFFDGQNTKKAVRDEIQMILDKEGKKENGNQNQKNGNRELQTN